MKIVKKTYQANPWRKPWNH